MSPQVCEECGGTERMTSSAAGGGIVKFWKERDGKLTQVCEVCLHGCDTCEWRLSAVGCHCPTGLGHGVAS